MRPWSVALPTARAVGRLGARTFYADATDSCVDAASNRIHSVFALADGVGDSAPSAHAAQLSATTAVHADIDDPVDAVMLAQVAVRDDDAAGDACLVVARHFSDDDGDGYHIAWTGDVRAYSWDGHTLTQLTTDHSVAEYFGSRGLPVQPRMAHMVTTTVRTAGRIEVGTATVRGPVMLLLTSDGVHKHVPHGVMGVIMRDSRDPANSLVDAAIASGGTDNATALVVAPPSPTLDSNPTRRLRGVESAA